MKEIILVFLFLLITTGKSVYAQVTDTLGLTKLSADGVKSYNWQKRNYEFFERVLSFSEVSWVSLPFTDWGIGDLKSPYILSADVSPHFTIGGENWPLVVQVTPRYKVRIMRDNLSEGDSSWAVRTPSYLPGISVFLPLSYNPFVNPRRKEVTHTIEGYRDLHYIGMAVFHHSNGQDGTELLPNGSYNTYNGNFSTNFLELSYNYNFRHKIRGAVRYVCPDNPYPADYYDFYGKISFEQHFSAARALENSYGRTRLNIRIGRIKVENWRLTAGKNKEPVGDCYRKERHRIIFNLSANLDKLDQPYDNLERRLNFDLGYYKRILAGNTAGFIMIGYYGNDPYNVYFEQRYPFIRGGIALGFFAFTRKTQ